MSTVVVCTKAPEYTEQSTASADSIFTSADKLCSADRELEHMVHLAIGSNTTPMYSSGTS
jgi:hypothetical protein